MSPLSNYRTDEYGGSFENRIRLTLEVFQAIRNAVPANYPIGVRFLQRTGWMLKMVGTLSRVLAYQSFGTTWCGLYPCILRGLHAQQNIKIGCKLSSAICQCN
jgi:hypothetical protein